MEASYFGARTNTALHTDVGSVLPTSPNMWNELPKAIRDKLAAEGVRLWHQLIEIFFSQKFSSGRRRNHG